MPRSATSPRWRTKTELWGIGLGNNFIKDFSTMTNVPKLGWADIYSNLIEDVSFIDQWPNCGSIWLSGNPFTDVSPLARATHLDRLQLENNAISDMSPFANFTPRQYSMNDNQGINAGDVTVDTGGEVTVATAKGRAGGYLRPKKISPEGGVYDASTGTVTWKNVSDDGVYSVRFSESDDRDYLYSGIVYRNVTVEHADKTPPDISGVFPTYSTLGEPYDPLFGVQAHDDVDGDITDRITVPLNEVDINKEGTYRVRYYVEDSAHNGSWSGRKVTVTKATISSIKVWPKWTDPGVAPDMGNYAEATWSDGNVTGEGVVWDKIDPKLYATPGNTFTVHGKVRGRDVSTTVTVRGEAPTIAVESVTISGDGVKDGAITLHTGDTAALKAIVKPDSATKKTVSWSSSSNYIASVNGEGKVTANKVGTATITASAGGKSASVTLTIPDRFSDVPNGKSFHDEIEWLAANGISRGNNDGTYGYDKSLSRQDMAIFLYRMAMLEHVDGVAEFTPSEADYAKFKDVRKGSFAAKEILWLAKVGITRGSNGRFNGTQTLTRQDIAIFLFRFANLAGAQSVKDFTPTDDDYARFKDVKRGTFAAKEILWLADARITLGNSDGTFGGNSKLSREAMAAFLYRIHNHLAK